MIIFPILAVILLVAALNAHLHNNRKNEYNFLIGALAATILSLITFIL